MRFNHFFICGMVFYFLLIPWTAEAGDSGYPIEIKVKEAYEEVIEGEWVTTVTKEGWVTVGKDSTSDPEGFSDEYLQYLEHEGYEYVWYYSDLLYHITWGYYAEYEEVTEWVEYNPPIVKSYPAEWETVFITEGTPPSEISVFLDDDPGETGFPDPDELDKKLKTAEEESIDLYEDFLDQCQQMDELLLTPRKKAEKRGDGYNSPLTGDPVRVSTGELWFKEEDGTGGRGISVLRNYGSFTRTGISFGESWAFSGDRRIIFGHDPGSSEKKELASELSGELDRKKDDAFSNYSGCFSVIDDIILSYTTHLRLIDDSIEALRSLVENDSRPPVIERLQSEIELFKLYEAELSRRLKAARENRDSLSESTSHLAVIDDLRSETGDMTHQFTLEDNYSRYVEQLNRYSLPSGSDPSFSWTGTGTLTYIDGAGTPVIYYFNLTDLSVEPKGEGIARYFAGCSVLRNQNGGETGVILEDGTITLSKKQTAREYFDKFGRLTADKKSNGKEYRYTYGSAGKLEKITDPFGNWCRVKRNASGLITEIAGSGEWTYRYGYDESCRLTQVTDPAGVTVSYSYSGPYLTKIIREDGSAITYEYSGHEPRRIEKVIDEEGYCETYRYSDAGRSACFTDKCGNRVRYFFDERGREIRRRYDDGVESTREYDSRGNLISLRDGCGNLTSFTYDAQNHCTYVHLPSGEVLEREYDKAGRLIRAADLQGRTVYFEYGDTALPVEIISWRGRRTISHDGKGNIVSITDEENRTTEYRYSSAGWLEKIYHAGGGMEEFFYDDDGRCTGYINLYGGRYTYSYDSLGRITEAADPAGGTEKWVYDLRGDMISYTGKNGTTVKIEYDQRHNPIKADGPGISRNNRYNGCGRIIRQNKNGCITEYEYDCRGNCTVERCISTGGVRTFRYDGCGRVTKVTAPGGGVTVYGYDGLGRLIRKEDPRGGVSSWEYKSGCCVGYENPLGGVTRYIYDSSGNCVRQIYPDGGTVRVGYDSMGRMVSRTDQEGNRWQYRRTGARITEELHPDGSSRKYRYNTAGDIIGVTTEGKNEISYRYDLMGRLTERNDQTLGTVKYSYTAAGYIKSIVKADGSILTFSYDDARRLTGYCDEEGNDWYYQYDKNGNLSREIDPEGNIWIREYDDAGRMTGLSDPSGVEVRYSYGPGGNIVSRTDGGEGRITYEYSPAGDCVTITVDDGPAQTFTYDTGGNCIRIITPEERKYEFRYDSQGRVIQEASPVEAEYRYDSRGNLSEICFPDGNNLSYRYDCMNRLTGIRQGDRILYSYRYGRDGFLREAESRDYQYYLSYDKAGRITGLIDRDSGVEFGFTYGPGGYRTGISTGNGREIRYTYDKRGNLIEAEDETGVVSFRYDKAGREILRRYGNGIMVERIYQGNRLRGIVCSKGSRGSEDILFGEAYLYDQCGRKQAVVNHQGEVTCYRYRRGRIGEVYYAESTWLDQINRTELKKWELPSASEPVWDFYPSDAPGVEEIRDVCNTMGFLLPRDYIRMNRAWKIAYTYDMDGNRLRKSTPLGDVVYRYDKASRLIQAGNKTITYNNGNISSTGEKTLQYSLDGKIENVETDTCSISYSYDPFGRLTGGMYREQNKFGSFRMFRDPVSGLPLAGSLTESAGPAGASAGTGKEKDSAPYRYRYLRVSESIPAGEKSFTAMPAPGSVIHLSFEDCGPGYLITDGANNVRASAETGSLHTDLIRCDAYGQTGPGIEQSFLPVPGFRGSLYLPKADLYDMGHRTYSAPAGRFFSPDPAREGINWYAYAGGDPVNFFDPFGLTVMGIIEGMRQQDKRWKDCQLGTEDTTIGKEGCKLTGITNIANAIIGKVEETPKSLNDLAVENDIYCGGGGALSTEGSKQLVNKAVDEITIAVERVETDGDKIYSKICELDNDTSVEVYIHVKIKTSALNDATNTYVHWVNIVDVDENGNLVVFDTSVRNRLTVEPAKLLAAEIFTAEKVK